jgi:hypothetical protein
MEAVSIRFIQTRIREQKEYIEKIMGTAMEPGRKIEVLYSARLVLKYWEQQEYEKTIGNET